MKKILLAATSLSLFCAYPAWSLSVSNLDKVPHVVTYDAAGSHFEQPIAPNDTIYINGVASGKLSLKSDSPKPSRGTIHADGMLSGIVGAERDQDIPADDQDSYVIWPGGKLMMQKTTRVNGRNN